MDTGPLLAVTHAGTLRFFFERLRDVIATDRTPTSELVYNASILAHFASTSTSSRDRFPAGPADLSGVFDVFVLDRSQHEDPDIMEAAAAQCLLLTGFFGDQLRGRHNVDWYAGLGAGFYDRAAGRSRDAARARMLTVMASRFEFWRRQQRRLARELRDQAWLIQAPRPVRPTIPDDDRRDVRPD
jgi:hypothetical protein